jgi:hypothetical protein
MVREEVAMFEWLKNMMKAGTGVSLSRHLMALVVSVVAFSLLYEVLKRGMTSPWAVTATGVVGSLTTIWGISKWRGNDPSNKPGAGGGTH